MAIRRKRVATYIADTGKEFELADMSDSHLLNAICHHLKQIEALEHCERYASPPHHLRKRRGALQQTVAVLVEELQTRDPDTEEERRKEIVERKWENRYGY
jgi:hypothetical protein